MPPRPPARWEEYQPLGSVIPGTKFIAFKVPLKEMICDHLPKDESFSPEQLVQSIKESGKSLGLVVDLTFTRKYYNGELSFTKHEIQYEKIFTEGHKVPSDDVFQRFWDVVDEFSMKNADEDVLIGVHCTHGVNRTGYLVCRYMIEKLKIEPEEAITLFGEARGHPIERENYISDLKTRPNPSANEVSSEEAFSDQRTYWVDQMSAHHQPQDSSRFAPHSSGKWDQSHGYQNYQNGGHFHRGPQPSGPYSGKLPGYQGQGRGRGPSFRPEWYPNRGAYSSYKGSQQGSQDQGYGGGRSYSRHASPLDSCEGPPQSGWGSAAKSGWGSAGKSGWGSSQSEGSWRQRDRGHNHNSNQHWGSGSRGHGSHRNYSWQRSDSNEQQRAGGGRGSFRDRMGHIGAGSYRGNYGGGVDNSRSAKDRNWRKKGPDEHTGAGGGVDNSRSAKDRNWRKKGPDEHTGAAWDGNGVTS